MSSISIKVPDLGADAKAELIEFLVKGGDQVKADTPLVLLESEKASIEVPAGVEGVVLTWQAKLGDELSSDDIICTIKPMAEDNKQQVIDSSEKVVQASSQSKKSKSHKNKNEGVATNNLDALKYAEAKTNKKTLSFDKKLLVMPSQVVNAGPAVRKLARELAVDLAKVNATGPKDRILKDDVKRYVRLTLQAVREQRPQVIVEKEIDFSVFGKVSHQRLSRVQQISAKRLQESWSHVPHVTQFEKADITGTESLRQQYNHSKNNTDVKLTLMPFLIKACAKALMAFPRLNSSIDRSQKNIVIKHYYNIGFAVDTPKGLLVPIIKQGDDKGVLDIAKNMSKLINLAQTNKLKPQDMQGASFTISSLGGVGGTSFTPIINPPEVAILGISKANVEAKWCESKKIFKPRLMLPLSLSYDHRVIDGVLAMKFLSHLVQILEKFDQELM